MLADGNALALAHELREIAFDGMEGNPGHGYRLPGRGAPRRQGDVEQRRGTPGVVKEQLVKIAHAVEEQDVGILALDAQVLLHHGRVLREGCVVHGGEGYNILAGGCLSQEPV